MPDRTHRVAMANGTLAALTSHNATYATSARLIIMLHDAIEIRKIGHHDTDEVRYEVYDSDTGVSLGLYQSMEHAEAERQRMKASDSELKSGSTDDDPSVE